MTRRQRKDRHTYRKPGIRWAVLPLVEPQALTLTQQWTWAHLLCTTQGAQPGWVGGLCRGAVSGCSQEGGSHSCYFCWSIISKPLCLDQREAFASEIDQKEGFTNSPGLEALVLLNNIYLLRISSTLSIVTEAFLSSPQILAKWNQKHIRFWFGVSKTYQ